MRPSGRAVATGIAVVLLVGAGLVLSPDVAIRHVRGVVWSAWFPVVLAGLYLIRPLLAWPISAISVLVGYRYGLVVGFPIAMAGVIATSCIPYAVARHLPTDAGIVGRASAGSERYFAATGDLRGVVAARLAPVPAEVISSAAGAGRVSLPAFVLGTAIGEIPWTAAAVLAGHSMHRLSLAGTVDVRLIAVGLLAGVLLLAGPAYRYLGDRYGS